MSALWMVILIMEVEGAQTPAVPLAGELSQKQGEHGELTLGRFQLRSDDHGGYVSETERFVARIAADGAVSFRPRPRLPGPVIWAVLIAAQVLQNATTPEHDSVPISKLRGDQLTYDVKTPTLTVGDDDLHRDSHHAQKMTFLDATASLRQRLRERHERAVLSSFRKQVDALAGDRRRPPGDRRRLLFDQWAECEDSPRGRAARAVLEEVARARFPPASPDAFTPAELSTLNGDRAAADRFDPYRPRENAGGVR